MVKSMKMDHSDGFVICVKTKAKANKIEKKEKSKGRKTTQLNSNFFGHKFFCVGSY